MVIFASIEDRMKSKGQITAFILAAAFLSFLLLWLCNAVWDSRYTFGAGDDSIIAASLGRRLFSSKAKSQEEYLAVNTSYDRELVPYRDEYGIPVGNVDIADRGKLVTLLDSLDRYRNYKYIVCDLLFDSSFRSDSDSSLFSLLAGMPRVVVPKEAEGLPDCLAAKAAASGYRIFHHGDPFLKYQFLTKGEESIPLRMWHELTGNTIVRHWWGYTSGGKPCNNAAVLDFEKGVSDITAETGPYNMVEKAVYHLGADIIDAGCPKRLFQDRIILIGDFLERDMHDTATGQVPGIMILYKAYRALEDGMNRIPWYCYLILYLLFFIYTLVLIAGDGWKVNNKFFAFLLDWGSFTLPLEVFNFITMSIGGFSVNAVLIGAVFGVALSVKKHFSHEK